MNNLEPRPNGTNEIHRTEPVSAPSYFPSAKSLLKNYEIRLVVHDIGATVHIGCKSIAFSDVSMARLEIGNWIDDPIGTFRKYQIELELENF